MSGALSRRAPPRPAALRGFAEVGRFWDAMARVWTAQVLPGEFYVSVADEVITTVLGSCVSACIRDAQAGVGGINHFMLPAEPGGAGGPGQGASPRYGQFALERLINELVKHGGRRERFEVKVFGGGRILPGLGDIGQMNLLFVRAFFATEDLPIASEDVGGDFARRLRYRPRSGQALIRRIATNESVVVTALEDAHRKALAVRAMAAPPPELF